MHKEDGIGRTLDNDPTSNTSLCTEHIHTLPACCIDIQTMLESIQTMDHRNNHNSTWIDNYYYLQD